MGTAGTPKVAAVAVALLTVTACGQDDGGTQASPDAADTTDAGTEQTAASPDDADTTDAGTEQTTESPDDGTDAMEDSHSASLQTADSELGTIVVDGEGMTLYQFDSDEQGSGASTCEEECAENWPPVHGDEMADAEGITGTVETITGTDGQPQLTLNGWPLYYYAGDEAPGDTNGQGVGDVWWVLTPDGEPIRD